MIKDSLKQIHATIDEACKQSVRQPSQVKLLAVSKHHDIDKIRKAYDYGQRDFGENYLNEALEKKEMLSELAIKWHFIGHIQSNKTRKITENFEWVHAVDSFKVAKRLSEQRPSNLPPINICLQINIDSEDSKAGISPSYVELLSVANEINQLLNVNLRGLMCIPAPKDCKLAEKESFSRMTDLLHNLNEDGLSMDTLSMGMSNDLDSAIACGATIVRVGTAIFGSRN